MRRRELLALGGSALVATLAGCSTGSDGNDQSDTSSDSTPDDGADGASAADEDGESGGGETETDDGDAGEQDAGGETQSAWPSGPYADYDTTTVTVTDEDGETLGEVTAALAESSQEWTLGLSAAESMPEDGGMLFVSEDANYESFWMRDMDFGLDIVFVGETGAITSIHSVPAPGDDEGTEDQYTVSGFGQYVFEVNAGWTAERGISEGDILEFEL